MISIRLADLSSPSDAKTVVSLLNGYAQDVMGGGASLPEKTLQNLPDALANHPAAHAFLAFVDHQPAGFSICFEAFSTFACSPILNIHDFAIQPDFRGRGIAPQLLSAIENHARSLGCYKLTLEVLENNQRARDIYHRFGFASYELDPTTGRALFYEKKF